MTAVRLPLGALAFTLVLGCTDRTVPDNESASSSLGTTADPSSTSGPGPITGPNPTSEPNPTAPNPTTSEPNPTTSGPNPTMASDPTTESDPVSTTTAVPATSDAPLDTGAMPFCGDGSCDLEESQCSCPDDCGGCELPPPLVSGCPAVWSGGSAVVGMTSFGPFDGHTAFFGWNGGGNTSWSELQIFIYDATADLEAAKQNPWSGQPYALELFPGWHQPEWVSQGVVSTWAFKGGVNTQHEVQLNITGTAGNWQRLDPNDPPRLLGEILPTALDLSVKGSFDAVFCDAFTSQIIPE